MTREVAAVALAAVAGACWPAITAEGRLRRVTEESASGAARWAPTAASPRSGRFWLLLSGCAAVLVVAGAAAGSLAAGVLTAAVGAAALHRWTARNRRRAASRRRAAAVELCQALAAELASGSPPRAALAAAADGLPGLDGLAPVARTVHGDIPAVLRLLGDQPGAVGLRRLEVCWVVCERSGGGLANAAARLAESLRDEEQVRREVAAQLAGPQATGALLALLPALGVAMGTAIGARPLALLLQTPTGLGCLVLGGVLEGLGVLWTARITRQAAPP
jgi:tight adherence protein B